MTRIDLMGWTEARARAMPIREAVFVREQGVPAEIEMDEMDPKSVHALAFEGDKPVATGRLLPDGHIGRMAVLKDSRRRGIGGALLAALLNEARWRGHAAVALSAQTHALPFYRAHGFMAEGGVYQEAGIPHQAMTLALGPLLLAECAQVAAKLAPQHCTQLPDGHTCAALHSSWPVLKLIGNVGTPGADRAFFLEALGALARPGLRVLVSGASDHGILEQVLDALGEARATARITVVDRCETPLLLNRWYTDKRGLRIETVRSDILTFAPAEPFDVICAHNFMEELIEDRWAALAARWRDWLRPGGALVAVIRLRSEAELAAEHGVTRKTPDFGPAVEKANAALPPALRLPVATTVAGLNAYWAERRTSGVRTLEAARALLAGAGFDIEREDEGAAPLTGRPAMNKTRRVRLLARRR